MTPTNTPGPSPTATPVPSPTTPPPNYITHEVQAGETLGEIADTYNVTVQEIQAANNLNDVLIHIGDRLIIPVPGPTSAAPVSTRWPACTTSPIRPAW